MASFGFTAKARRRSKSGGLLGVARVLMACLVLLATGAPTLTLCATGSTCAEIEQKADACCGKPASALANPDDCCSVIPGHEASDFLVARAEISFETHGVVSESDFAVFLPLTDGKTTAPELLEACLPNAPPPERLSRAPPFSLA